MRTHRTAGGPPALGLLAATLALLLSAAACTGDDPDPRDPSSTWSPTGTMDPPSPTATEPTEPTEPVLPDAAKQASEDGARAFITYYWDLINYAQATGDVARLRSVSGQSCKGCTRAINAVTDLYGSGGRAVGGEYSLTVKRVKDISPSDKSSYGIEAKVEVRNAPQTIYRADGSQEKVAPKDSPFVAYLIWINNAWRTDVLESL